MQYAQSITLSSFACIPLSVNMMGAAAGKNRPGGGWAARFTMLTMILEGMATHTRRYDDEREGTCFINLAVVWL